MLENLGTWENQVADPTAVFDGTDFQMWYEGRAITSGLWFIGHATSSGSWDALPSPGTALRDGGMLRTWYSGQQDAAGAPPQIGYATHPCKLISGMLTVQYEHPAHSVARSVRPCAECTGSSSSSTLMATQTQFLLTPPGKVTPMTDQRQGVIAASSYAPLAASICPCGHLVRVHRETLGDTRRRHR